MQSRNAKFGIGQVVKHRFYPFRGVIFDVDPIFANTEEWWRSIPAEVRPAKEQPFYHLYAENEDSQYVAYVSEQNSGLGRIRRASSASAGQRGLRTDARREVLRPRPITPELDPSLRSLRKPSANAPLSSPPGLPPSREA